MLQSRQLFPDQFLLCRRYLLKRLRVVLLPGQRFPLIFEPNLLFQFFFHFLALHGKSFLFDPFLVYVVLVLILDGFVPLGIRHSELLALGLPPNLLIDIKSTTLSLAGCHALGHTRRPIFTL